ncbi:winged helix-turn-helix transcriptional regulator [Natronococcus wangiae]|uniref:winged helix-turn-helix transcriptional regulator n=1 Tax=Natronococcus wangiae TaxID=3068275 RepID=UPI00273D5C5C|nr:helix-turn-helix domain-containing protein [Natronococcus sp. AD5]
MSQHGSCDCCSPSANGAVPSGDGAVCYCPVDGVIETISKKYALQIVGLVGAHGPMRYGELEDRLNATSSSLLSERLEELTDEGILERRSFDEIPPRVEYSLTPRGRELETRIQPLLEWAAAED